MAAERWCLWSRASLAREWAHWVGVQNDAFPGTIDGSLQLGHLGSAFPVRAEDGSLDDLVAYGVVVRASVTFELTDETGEQVPSLVRSMDGMVVMVQGTDQAFRVINFVRDGRRLDEFFQVFDDARERRKGVTVEVRNLIHLERWQFGIEITNDTDRPLQILPTLTALLAPQDDPGDAEQPLVTFPRRISPGESAEGIVSFAAPTTAGRPGPACRRRGAGRRGDGVRVRPSSGGDDAVALTQSGDLALPRQPTVHALVRAAIRLDVLLSRNVLEGDALESGGDAPRASVEWLEVRGFHPIAAGELVDQEQAVGSERHGTGVQLRRQLQALDHRRVLGHVVRRLSDTASDLGDDLALLGRDLDADAGGTGIATGSAVAGDDQVTRIRRQCSHLFGPSLRFSRST